MACQYAEVALKFQFLTFHIGHAALSHALVVLGVP